ncbi:hypothetical protein B566_EDAN013386 [Ephemera danica]|nr:hypothetical protein B566_EDAN013386 [Ephemera danica]
MRADILVVLLFASLANVTSKKNCYNSHPKSTTTWAPRPQPSLCPACVNARCDPNSSYAMGVAYPGDCSKFCKCEVGGAILFHCPTGLRFDETLGVCVWPYQSSCKNDDPYPECSSTTSGAGTSDHDKGLTLETANK